MVAIPVFMETVHGTCRENGFAPDAPHTDKTGSQCAGKHLLSYLRRHPDKIAVRKTNYP